MVVRKFKIVMTSVNKKLFHNVLLCDAENQTWDYLISFPSSSKEYKFKIEDCHKNFIVKKSQCLISGESTLHKVVEKIMSQVLKNSHALHYSFADKKEWFCHMKWVKKDVINDFRIRFHLFLWVSRRWLFLSSYSLKV